jgi:hypothetical protein
MLNERLGARKIPLAEQTGSRFRTLSARNMPALRFKQEREFIRFLNDTELLRHGRIRAVIRKRGFGGALEVMTDALPDADFETVAAKLTAYGAGIAAAGDPAEAQTRGLDMGRYIETIQPEPNAAAAGHEPLTRDLLLMVDDQDGLFERTRDQVFRFGCERGFRVMAGKAGDRRFFLMRLEGLASLYPVLQWQSQAGYSFFTPLEGNPGCFVQHGYRFPLLDLQSYHPGLGAINLIGEGGWWWKSGTDAFHPVGDLCDVRFAGAHTPVQIDPVPPEQLPKFSIELRLVKEEGIGLARPPREAEGGPDSARSRLAELETKHWEIDTEIERMRHFSQLAPVGYWFDVSSVAALIRFVTHYPPPLVQKFLYCPIQTHDGQTVHVVVPSDMEQPSYMPPEVARDARTFERYPSWFARHRIQVFVPQGFEIVPPLEFSSAEPLLRVLGGAPKGHYFFLDTDTDGKVISVALPLSALLTLDRSIECANRAKTAQSIEQTGKSLGASLVGEQQRSFEQTRERLEALGQQFAGEFTGIMDRYREEMRKAVALLAERKKTLQERLDLVSEIEQFEKTVQEIRDRQVHGLGEFLQELERALNRMVVERDRQEDLILRQFQSVQRKMERLRSRRESELQAFRSTLQLYVQDRDARRDALAQEISTALAALKTDPLIEGADEITGLLEETLEKLKQ